MMSISHGGVVGTYEHEIEEPWDNVSQTVIAGSNTTPAVTARGRDAVEALSNICLIRFPDGTCGAEFRFESNDANNASIVLDLMGKRTGDLYYNRLATITLTVGQQTARTGYTFVDTVVVSNELFNQEIKAVTSTGDYIGRLLMNLRGYKDLIFLATTITGSTKLYIDVARCSASNVFLKA
jgi:hypothetical protein